MAINKDDVRTFNKTWFSGSNSIDNDFPEFSLQSGSFVISYTSGYFHVNENSYPDLIGEATHKVDNNMTLDLNSENLIDCHCILYLSGSNPKNMWNNNVAFKLNNEQLIILENNQ